MYRVARFSTGNVDRKQRNRGIDCIHVVLSMDNLGHKGQASDASNARVILALGTH